MSRETDRQTYPLHFDGQRFFNPGAPQAHGLRELLRWVRTRHQQPSPTFLDDVTPTIPPRAVRDALRCTLVNHSTVLLQFDGLNLLTDPVWSDRISPVSFAGPRRRRAPGVRWQDLPPIDVVLLSHNHYDHFDLPTLRKLVARSAETIFVAPKGVGALLISLGAANVHDLDWGDSVDLRYIAIHALPAFHFSGRGLHDRNRTLWCGYQIQASRSICFAGDTAFGDHFHWIRDRFPSPDLALLPIGAYLPRWFMSPVHMAPEDAVNAQRILSSRRSIAIHHGTFHLADEALDQPPLDLAASPGGEAIEILHNGEFAVLE